MATSTLSYFFRIYCLTDQWTAWLDIGLLLKSDIRPNTKRYSCFSKKKIYSLCFSYRHTSRSKEFERAQRSVLYISSTQSFPSRVALHKGTYNRFEKLYICLTIKGCLISYCCTFDLGLQKNNYYFWKIKSFNTCLFSNYKGPLTLKSPAFHIFVCLIFCPSIQNKIRGELQRSRGYIA